ncbi:hypothetical protein EK21DRAFT_110045 [Setomelanomma holmii]|uniref:Uncharacterized protein n=1 Tax=Setomelanomma holmii TaxID=210430 RepID=A0A9P4LPM8_9PLEO|nr:hypothetical protein EK21DRAFT_110045 [Setomelanomma holmii]
MKLSTLFAAVGLATGIDACFLTAHSSAIGDFHVRHSEPKDHDGSRQFVNWSHGACMIKGELLDGCNVKTSSTSGCGFVSFSIWKPGRFVRGLKDVKSSV